MARQSASVVENSFTGGLITETTELKFPPNACVETFDCVFDETGRVTRRLGFDLENNYVLQSVTEEALEVFTEYLWTAVAGDGTKNFFVQQQGSMLRFYDLATSLDLSANVESFTVDLNTYIPSGGAKDPATEQCQYTTNIGNLIVCNAAINPIFIVYTSVSNTITPTAITIKARDFAGLTSEYALTTRPVESVATLKSAHVNHYYNLLNQGWYHGSTGTAGPDTAATLAQWDAGRTDLPSLADTVGLYRSSATAAWANANVLANSPGSTPAPKGHFILSATSPDRTAAMVAEGFTGATVGVVSSPIADGTGTIIGNYLNISRVFTPNPENWSSGSGGQPAQNTAQTLYVGKTIGTPSRIASATFYGAADGGVVPFSDPSVTTKLYGKNGAAPANGTDGTEIGTVTFTDNNTATTRVITSTDTATFWDHVWINTDAGSAVLQGMGYVQFLTVVSSSGTPSTTERPNTLASFAGRVFYAGVNDLGLNSSIFFTRIIEKNTEYEECYQRQDPTAEDLFDLLPDDGGVIKIPEIGKIIKLFAYQTSLIILATNGVWRIAGGSGAFAANDYQIRKLSSIGTDAALSIADYKGLPIWWGEDGINTIQYDANYDSFAVISITDATIKSFILSIPEFNRQFVKAAFDVNNDTIFWLYNSDPTLAVADQYKYDRVLLMNGLSKAFYPWTISISGTGVTKTPDVRGVAYVTDGARTLSPLIKYTVTHTGSSAGDSLEYLTFAEAYKHTYTDWDTPVEVGADDDIDYISYFITGHRIDAQGMRFFQSNWMFVYLEPEADSSCYLQHLWDWYTDPSSGKWSTSQQVYNSATVNRSINFRRLKVRGKGRNLQMKFESETGKPFNIIGWGIHETANAEL